MDATETRSPDRHEAADVLTRLVVALHEDAERRRLRTELAAEGPEGGLGQALEMLGLRPELLRATLRNASAERMYEMLHRRELDAEALWAAGELHGAEARCRACSDAERCDDWLEGASVDEPHAFCPNAPLMDRLAEAGPAADGEERLCACGGIIAELDDATGVVVFAATAPAAERCACAASGLISELDEDAGQHL